MTLDLSRLSPDQRRVALAPDGPLVVVAGPGSGKTTALAARVAVLATLRGIGASRILVLTFTTAAARELRARLARFLGETGRRVDVCTFHAFGLRLVREWSRALGLGPGPLVVYGAEDAHRLLQQAGDALGLDADGSPAARWPALVEWFRLEAATLAEHGHAGDDQAAGVDPRIAALAHRYELLLAERGAVDFPAMLALPLRLFARRADALRRYQDAYRHLLCDEAQDLCPAQHELLRRLAERHQNLTAVGDPRQTIYGWRGADVRFLLEFGRDFPGARVMTLDQNFRSSRRIVAFANALGAPLEYRRPLWTDNEPGHTVVLHLAADERAEAAFVAAEIARLLREGQIDCPGDAAVLFRTNRQAHDLALGLRARGIAYVVWGPGDLFARREVRDAVAFLRLAHNPADGVALARVVDAPPRGLARVAAVLRRDPAPVSRLPALAARHAPEALAAAGGLAGIIEHLNARSRPARPAALLDEVMECTGYRAWLAGLADGDERLQHLAALRRLADTDQDLGEWLAELQLDAAPGSGAGAPDRVVLTTVHAAKGKEWRVVFVTGVEEGLLPHSRALLAAGDERQSLLEELRVAYVAVTRPRDRLYLTSCRRRRGGEVDQRRPSRFLRHVPSNLLRRTGDDGPSTND